MLDDPKRPIFRSNAAWKTILLGDILHDRQQEIYRERGMMKIVVAAAVCAALAGCLDKTSDGSTTLKPVPTPETPVAEGSAPAINMTTPEKALESYWAVIDWKRRQETEKIKADLQSPWGVALHSAVGTVTTAEFNAIEHVETDTFHRNIFAIDVESDQRVTLTTVVKNSPPVPPGTVIPDFEREQRTYGARYRYVMQRSEDGWRVAEVWQHQEMPEETWTKVKPYPPTPMINTVTIIGI